MTFQVRDKCLICRTLTDPTINSVKEANVEALNLLHYKLCAAMKLKFSPKREWDFADEPFPYCESCSQRVHRLGELMDQLKKIEDEINGALATVSALVITSYNREINTNNDPPLATPNLGQMKEYFKSRRLQEKHDYFRSLVIQRLDPRVYVERCDSSCVNYRGFSAEQYDYELLPKPLLLKTEPSIEEGFSDTVEEEEEMWNETESLSGEASSAVISGDVDESIRLNEVTTLLPQSPDLTFLITAPVKEEKPIKSLPKEKGLFLGKLDDGDEIHVLERRNDWLSTFNGIESGAHEDGGTGTASAGVACIEILGNSTNHHDNDSDPSLAVVTERRMQPTFKERKKKYDRLRNLNKKRLAANTKIIVDTELERWLAVLEQKGIRRELPNVRSAAPIINNLEEIKTYNKKQMESWIKRHTKWTLKKEAPQMYTKTPEYAFFYAGNHYRICPFCDIHPEIVKPLQKLRITFWCKHVQTHSPLPCYATNCRGTYPDESRRRRHMRQVHFKPITRQCP